MFVRKMLLMLTCLLTLPAAADPIDAGSGAITVSGTVAWYWTGSTSEYYQVEQAGHFWNFDGVTVCTTGIGGLECQAVVYCNAAGYPIGHTARIRECTSDYSSCGDWSESTGQIYCSEGSRGVDLNGSGAVTSADYSMFFVPALGVGAISNENAEFILPAPPAF